MKAYKVGLPGLFLFLFALAGSSESIKEEGGALMLNAWVVSTLKAEGLAPELIADLTARIRNQDYKNIHSLLIARNGNLVYEEYFPGADGRRGVVEFDKETLHDTRSVSKSIASSLIGIAIDQGRYIQKLWMRQKKSVSYSITTNPRSLRRGRKDTLDETIYRLRS